MKQTSIKLPKNVHNPFSWATVEYDNGMKSFDPLKLSLHLEPEQVNGSITGLVLAERLKATAPTSNVLQYLIDNPEHCPEEWKKANTYVYFWGTIFRRADGSLYVRVLYWLDGQWQVDYDWLDYDWDVVYPAAVLASPSSSSLSSEQHSDALHLDLESRIASLEKWRENFIKTLTQTHD